MYTIIILIISMLYLFPNMKIFIFSHFVLPLWEKIKYIGMMCYNKMVIYLRNYLMAVIQDKEMNDALNDALKLQLNTLLTNKQLNQQLIETVKTDAKILSLDPEVNGYIHEIIQTQLESTDTSQRSRAAVAKILKTQIETMTKEDWFVKEVKDQITTIVVNTCECVEVKNKLKELLETLSSDLVCSGEINKKINELISKIINDEEFIKNIGSGIRKSIRNSVYGVFWQEARPEQSNKADRDYDQEKNFKIVKEEQIERPSVDKLRVSIIKNRSNSIESMTSSQILEK